MLSFFPTVKKYKILLLSLFFFSCITTSDDLRFYGEESQKILEGMTLKEKIGQKIILDFRYWCADNTVNCSAPLLEMNPVVTSILRDNNIGGVILFSENQSSISATVSLIAGFEKALAPSSEVGLFISIDQEGGNVVRLPRDISTNFSGNLALSAAYLGTKNKDLAYKQGLVLGKEIASLGYNVNFAPVMDVNSNPFNPVINVRSFGDSAKIVGRLGGEEAKGIRDANVASGMKHFPGHGDTAVDSHYGLPVVTKSRKEAYAIDLAPYRIAIRKKNAPDMIMTAHIQYPSLDNSLIRTNSGDSIITPATLSYKIQSEILRDELHFKGVTITDALDMKALSDRFSVQELTEKVFAAGVDIALMPVSIRREKDKKKIEELIAYIAEKVRSGALSEEEIDLSVKRILATKLRRGIRPKINVDVAKRKADALEQIGSSANKKIEKEIAQASITLLKNKNSLLPLEVSELGHVYILMPWFEQANGLKKQFLTLGVKADDITVGSFESTSWRMAKEIIKSTDTLLIGSLAGQLSPVEFNGDPSLVVPSENNEQFIRNILEYAEQLEKQRILLTLRMPYDVVHYDDVSDAVLASYSYLGYRGGTWKSLSLPAVVNVIMGKYSPQGKLPINLPEIEEGRQIKKNAYDRGFGLSY